jgi:NAD(P)-dependent dehydrogenase (short-subunit alcohol dehydrogenase family)
MNQPDPTDAVNVVIGASGGIGGALLRRLQGTGGFGALIGLSRVSSPALDLADEASIAGCAEFVARHGKLRLVVVATGLLHGDGIQPEKSVRELNAVAMSEMFAVNTLGPALVLKHFLPLLARDGRAVLAVLSARVGSIGDNKLGGWYSYRASKAALNQMLHTAAVELRRSHRHAICVALHPGTVNTRLSAPFSKAGLELQDPDLAAERLLAVIDSLTPEDSGRFFDHRGEPVPW